MTTTPLGIWTPNDGDDWDLTIDLSAMANTVDAAILAQRLRTEKSGATVAALGTGDFVGQFAWVTGVTGRGQYQWTGSTWVANGYSSDGAGGGNITTAWTESAAPASVTLPPGVWSVAASVFFTLSTAANVNVAAHLFDSAGNALGSGQETSRNVGSAAQFGTSSFSAEFTRAVTLTSTTTVRIRRRTSATGGTQSTVLEHLVATRMS